MQDKILLELVPMVKLDGAQKKKKLRWHSSHIFLYHSPLEKVRLQALSQSHKIEANPSRTEGFAEGGPSAWFDPVGQPDSELEDEEVTGEQNE